MGFNQQTIICGYGGINRNANLAMIPLTDLENAINLTIARHTFAKMRGASKYNGTIINDASTEIQALYAFPAHTVITQTTITGTEFVAASGDDGIENKNDGLDKIVTIDDDYLRVAWSNYASNDTGWLSFENASNIGRAGSRPSGTVDWANPSNALASDDAYASANTTTSAYSSTKCLRLNLLNSSNLVDIQHAVITGIEVKIERIAEKADIIQDKYIDFSLSDTDQSNNKAVGTMWPTNDTYETYGGAADIWGLLSTTEIIDFYDGSLDFNVIVRNMSFLSPPSETCIASIDDIQIKLYYEIPRSTMALRFTSIALPVGAAILSAYMKLTPYSSMSDTVAHGGKLWVCKAAHTSGAASEPGVGGSYATYWRESLASETEVGTIAAWLTATAYTSVYATDPTAAYEIRGIYEADADCDIFTNGTSDPPSDRALTTTTETWGCPAHLGHQLQIDTDDIYDIVQEQIDHGNWASGQDLGFIIAPKTGEPIYPKDFYAYDEGTAAYKAELYIQYQTEAPASETFVGLASNKHLYGIKASGAHDDVHTYTNYDADVDDAPVILEGFNAVGSKAVFVFNGDDPVRQWDGGGTGTDADITNPPSDWGVGAVKYPRFAVMHNNRMFAGGVEGAEHTLYYTSTTDHEDYRAVSGGGTLQVYSGEGEKLVGGISFMGKLFLFKYPKGIYVLDDASISVGNWGVFRISSDVGLAGPRAIAGVGKSDVIFMGDDGFLYSLKTAWTTGNAEHSQIMRDKYYDWRNDNVTLSSGLSRATLVFESVESVLYILMTAKDSVDSRIALGIDLTEMQKPKFLEYNRDDCASIINNKGSIMVGGMDGYVYSLCDGTYNKDSNAYSCELLTAPIYLTNKGMSVAGIKAITLVFAGAGRHVCTVTGYIDGTQMGSAVEIDASTSKKETFVTRKLNGECNMLQIKVENTTVDTSFSLARMIIHYLPGAEKTK